VRDEVRRACGDTLATGYAGSHAAAEPTAATALVDVPMYRIDALVRRAPSLQRTREGRAAPAVYE